MRRNLKMQNDRKRILLSIALILAAVAIVLAIAWKTGPFFYHFAEIRLVTLYSFFQLLATAYISFLICKHLGKESSLKWHKSPFVRPFFISAIGFLFLGLDEILSIHENLDKLIHHILMMKETPWTDHIDDIILLFYGLIAIFFVKDFIKEFKRHPYMIGLLIGGFLLFFTMFYLDFVSNNTETFTHFLSKSMAYGDLRHRQDIFRMVEDSAKILGEAFFLSAFAAAFVDIKTGSTRTNPQ